MLNLNAQSRSALQVVLALLAFTASLAGPTASVTAQDQAVLGVAQNGSAACKINGKLVVPIVDPTHTYGWSFVANFDHAPSATNVRTCLAERYFGLPATYTVANHCTVMNNIASPPVQFGNGSASFDGNAYLSCTIPVPQSFPDVFFARVRMIPLAASIGLPGIKSYTFLSSNNATVTAQTDASCLLTSAATGTGVTCMQAWRLPLAPRNNRAATCS